MTGLSSLRLAVAGLLVFLTTIFLRVIYIHPAFNRSRSARSRRGSSHVVVVLGSGGHTGEMMSLLRDLDPRRYTHRTYIVSSGDNFSAGKAADIEKVIQAKHIGKPATVSKMGEVSKETGMWEVMTVPRARQIHQPLYTAPFSSLLCLLGCLKALRQSSRTFKGKAVDYPDTIVTNGPATAVIVILAAFILRFFGFAPVHKMRIIYVESWARVRTLSLSGKLLLYLGVCDRFLVQWKELSDRINGTGRNAKKKVEWVGFLVE